MPELESEPAHPLEGYVTKIDFQIEKNDVEKIKRSNIKTLTLFVKKEEHVFSIYKKVLMENEDLISFSATGIVVQAYLRDGFKHLRDIAAFAKSRGIVMPIRLVKGAYWDAETIEADAHNFLAPEFLNKEETDIHFRQLIDLSLKSGDSIQLAVASHNIQDHAFAEALREIRYPEAPVIEHQCLHMTYEAVSYTHLRAHET